MPKSLPLNAAMLIAIALIGYFFTAAFDTQKPKVMVQPEAPVAEIKTGQTVPGFLFKGHNEEIVGITDFEGKIIVLNFWASWCPPCVKEFPELLKISAEFPDDVVLLALSSDLEKSAMTNFIKKLQDSTGLKTEAENIFITLDENEITKDVFQTFQLPETIIIDRNQIMRKKFIGADWQYEDMEGEIEKLLAE